MPPVEKKHTQKLSTSIQVESFFYPKLRNILHRLLLQKAVTHCFKHKAENKMFIIHILCIIYVDIFMYKCTCAVRPYLHTYSNNTLYIHIVQNET